MMITRYAQLNPDSTVANVIVLDPDDCGGYPLAGLLELAADTPVEIGWTHNGDGTFTEPPPLTVEG